MCTMHQRHMQSTKLQNKNEIPFLQFFQGQSQTSSFPWCVETLFSWGFYSNVSFGACQNRIQSDKEDQIMSHDFLLHFPQSKRGDLRSQPTFTQPWGRKWILLQSDPDVSIVIHSVQIWIQIEIVVAKSKPKRESRSTDSRSRLYM